MELDEANLRSKLSDFVAAEAKAPPSQLSVGEALKVKKSL